MRKEIRTCLLLGAMTLLLAACAATNRPLQLLSGAGPVYPAEARAEGVEGSVTVRYDVEVDGTVSNARVVASSPAGVFDEAALVAVRSWRFNPPLVEGQAQPAKDRESSVEFKVSGGDAYDNY